MLQLFEEVENISLDRHIQSGDALICNHKFWPRCQCPSNGNPLSFQHHNLSRTTKVALSSTATETLFNSNNGTWIKSDSPAFSSALLNTNEHDHTAVTLTANNGVTASGFQGWSNFNIAGGGDFNLSMTNGSTCTGTTTNGLDHHSGTYYHLNCGCQRHYL